MKLNLPDNRRSQINFLIRFLAVWLLQSFALILTSFIVSGFYIEDIWTAMSVVLIVSIINAFIWPVFVTFALPITVYTLGLFSLFLNMLVFWIAFEFVEGVVIESTFTLLLITFVATAITTILTSLFAIDDDSTYYRNVIKKLALKKHKPKTNKPGLLLLEIDGLSYPMIKIAMKRGYMPTLSSWIKSKSHRLTEWETDLSSQTSVCQAGILHGNNKNMPAFRWLEKSRNNAIVSSSNSKDATMVEKRQSNNKGLLSKNGASRSNMFSGDAKDVVFTASKISGVGSVYNPALFGFFSVPYNYTHTLILFIGEVGSEYISRFRQWAKKTEPRLGRHHRGGIYPFLRAFTTVMLRDITIYTLIGDIYGGEKDVMYSTFVGYDEVAHHSGIDDKDVYSVLRKLDRQFKRVKDAIDDAERKYHIVVLSDHGQSKGATFKQRYGLTLEELINQLIDTNQSVQSILETNEGWGHLNTMLTEAVNDNKHKSTKTIRKVLRGKLYGDSVVMGPDAEIEKQSKNKTRNNIVVLGSGNLGLLYFTQWKRKLNLEQIEKNYPRLIIGLTQHDGVGIVAVRSKKHGNLAIGRKGVYHLDTGKIEGDNPLSKYSNNAPMHISRALNYKNAPDIYMVSMFDKKNNQVAAFEELIGSHGGLGGWQSRPFILYPSKLSYPKNKVIGAEGVYKVVKSWSKYTH